MLGLLFLLLSIFVMGIFMFKIGLKKRKDITFDIKTGEICVGCKSDTGFKIDWMKVLSYDFKEQRFCASCVRDKSINDIVGSKKINIGSWIRRNPAVFWRISKILYIVSIAFNLIALAYKPVSILGSLFLSLAVCLSFKAYLSTTIKK